MRLFNLINVIIFVLITNNLGLALAKNTKKYDQKQKKCQFPAIFNFGDSNSDTGGLSALGLVGMAPPPNGQTFFGAPAGRYCDGRLIIDFLAEKLDLPYLSAYLNSVGSNFSHGANFATAASTVRTQNTTTYSPVSLNVQFTQYSDFITNSQLVRKQGGIFEGLLPKEEYLSGALYTFDIGQNDLTAGYRLNMTTDQVKSYIPDVIRQFSNVVRIILDPQYRPIGLLAYMLDSILITAGQVDEFGCISPLNEVSQLYNTKLKEAVIQLRKDLPLVAITYVDIYPIKLKLITQPNQFGFVKPLVACCGIGGKYNFNNTMRCGSTEIVNGKEVLVAKSCKDPSTRVSWDGIHYTEAANKWIFDQIMTNSSYLDPPISLGMACHKFK